MRQPRESLPAGVQACDSLRGPGEARCVMAVDRLGQAEVFTERHAFILLAEETPVLQFRNHEIDEVLERARQPGRHHVEAVGGTTGEPLLDPVGDLLGRARAHPVPARSGQPVTTVDLRYRNGFAVRVPSFREKPTRKT